MRVVTRGSVLKTHEALVRQRPRTLRESAIEERDGAGRIAADQSPAFSNDRAADLSASHWAARVLTALTSGFEPGSTPINLA